jgi:3-oxoacyl-(acyl-carrier-protein) synthase
MNNQDFIQFYSFPHQKSNRYFEKTDSEIADFLDKSKSRMMNRSTLLLLQLAHDNRLNEKIINFPREKIGLYSANKNGEYPYSIYSQSHDQQKIVKNLDLLSPQSLFKRSNAISTAQIATYLDIRGPALTFSFGIFSAKHAIEQACSDLRAGRTEFAIVCSSIALLNDAVNHPAGIKNECAIFIGFKLVHVDRILNLASHFEMSAKYDGPLKYLLYISKELA